MIFMVLCSIAREQKNPAPCSKIGAHQFFRLENSWKTPGGLNESQKMVLLLLRANPPVRPHNFLGILKEYKFRPPLNFTFNWEDQQG